MSIPQIATPLFHLTLPSTGEQITYRPFLVKEEKLLLIAKEADDEESIMTAVLQILGSCTNNEIDLKSLASSLIISAIAHSLSAILFGLYLRVSTRLNLRGFH